MRAATEGSLPPVMPQGNLVEVLGREVRQGSPGELMVESTPSRQRRPPCKTNKEESDEAADAAALTYLLTYCHPPVPLLATDQNKPIDGKEVFLLWQDLFLPKGNRPDPSLEAEFPMEEQIHELYSNFNQIISDPTITPQLFRYFTVGQQNA